MAADFIDTPPTASTMTACGRTERFFKTSLIQRPDQERAVNTWAIVQRAASSRRMIVAEMTPTGAWQRSAVSTETPAKINLTLDILGVRPDGYHELRSLVIGVDLRDTLTVADSSDSKFAIRCNVPALQDESNLAVRAAAALAKSLDRTADVAIELVKRIPLGGGLGGGSSDAAAALRLCNQLWGANLCREELARVGACLGSDVPLFFHLPSALMTGRGETVADAPMRWSGWALLLMPEIHVSTAEVYRAWKPADSSSFPQGADAELIRCRTAGEMSALLSNQLEPAVFRVASALRQLRDALQHLCGGPVRVSGSGSSMFMLFDDPQAAASAAASVEGRLPHVKALVARAPVGEGPLISCQ